MAIKSDVHCSLRLVHLSEASLLPRVSLPQSVQALPLVESVGVVFRISTLGSRLMKIRSLPQRSLFTCTCCHTPIRATASRRVAVVEPVVLLASEFIGVGGVFFATYTMIEGELGDCRDPLQVEDGRR